MKSNCFKMIFMSLITSFIFLFAITQLILNRNVNLEDLTNNQYKSDFILKIKNHKNYENLTGKGVKIAIVDSGISREHKDLINIKLGYRVQTKNSVINDTTGHGTEIAGIISASNNKFGIVGIAPGSEVYPVSVLNKNGNSSISNIIEAIKWCISNQIDIINLSISTSYNDQKFKEVIATAISNNIIIVASYSNQKNTYDYPAMYANVIGVKSTVKNEIKIIDNIVFAPGFNIVTTSTEGNYTIVNGNSFATANITGFAALLKEKYERKGENLAYIDIINEIKDFNN
ncbi:MAG: S8 family serine peptidase [Candidatus Cloacimonetes bacterium]|nr:S8 family serine peptidase [Candidatus Cloacimonadota bacterium]